MELELQSLIDNKIYDLVELLRDQTLIDCNRMYKLKCSAAQDKKIIFKIKLVARDFTQEKSVDYNKKLSSVAKYATFFLECALATIFNLVMD